MSGDPELSEPRTINISGEKNGRTVELSESTVFCKGEWLTASPEGEWRFVRCVERGEPGDVRAAAQVVSGEGLPREVILPNRWFQALLPIHGGEDEAMALAVDRVVERHVTAHLVTPASSTEIGDFYRSDHVGMGSARWQALRLDDEQVALVSLETENYTERSMITLRIFDQSKQDEILLPFPESVSFHSIAAAVDRPRNKLGVIALETGGGIWSLTLKIDGDITPLSAPRKLTEEMVSIPSPGIRVAAADGRFVVAWIREGNLSVRLCEFSEDLAFPPVSIGESTGRELLELRSFDEEIQVVWQSGEVVQRSLPFRMTGYILADRFLSLLGQTFKEGDQ